jgi:hypothetical protein
MKVLKKVWHLLNQNLTIRREYTSTINQGILWFFYPDTEMSIDLLLGNDQT